MKKTAIIILTFILCLALLNVKVTTRKGIDCHVREIQIPLYLKALDYLDRHYDYIELVGVITNGAKDKDEKVLKILDWVHANIRHTPPGFPVVDDHPLNIIIRGYGVRDQYEDIFTVLCYYTGARAFYASIKNSKGQRFQISFVKLHRGWSPISAYSGIYAKKGDHIATVKEISDDTSLAGIFAAGIDGFETKAFFDFVNSPHFEARLMHTTAQSPLGRAAYQIKAIFCRRPGRILIEADKF